MTWNNPLNSTELVLSGEATINTWRLMKSSDKMWRESVRLAWEISPLLAIHLPCRLKSTEKSVVSEEVARLARYWPETIMHIPEGLTYLVTSDMVLNDAPEVCTNSNEHHSLKLNAVQFSMQIFHVFIIPCFMCAILLAALLYLDLGALYSDQSIGILQPTVSSSSLDGAVCCSNFKHVSGRCSVVLYSSTCSSFAS